MAEIEASKAPYTPNDVDEEKAFRASSRSEDNDFDEKRVPVDHNFHGEQDHQPIESKIEDQYNPNVRDPFPIDPDMPEETHQLTVRALVVGAALGCVVGASNIYLGLKTGFTFGPQLFGAIFGFSIIKAMSKALPSSGFFGVFGGYFGPKENCTVQTAATSAGGLGILFVSAVPAMYKLGLLSPDPKSDFGRLIALTVACGYFGVFFVIPLRTYFILRQRLVFPTPTATAFTIRSLHSGPHGEVVAKLKAKCLGITMASCFCFKVLNGYIPGIFLDWHIGWTLFQLGWPGAIGIENYGFILEFTPAFFGAGMLSGINASWSFFGGSVLAWGIIAPSIVKTGQAIGHPYDDSVPEYINYLAMSFKPDADGTRPTPSPRYWLLWPGVLLMLVFSFVEIGMSTRSSLWAGIKSTRGLGDSVKRIFVKDPDYVPHDDDPAPLQDRVKTWWWVTGTILSLIVSCALMGTQFNVGVGETILALLLGFVFSFIGVQSSGDTDINPVSTCAKASQIVFGGVTKGQGISGNPAMLVNLIAGSLSAGAAAQATDMVGDLKTGHLLRAKPKNQFAAQLFGTTIAIFLSTGLFVLFTTASPCILTGAVPCPYYAPSVSAWAAVAYAVTAPDLPVPATSGYCAIVLAVVAAVTVVIKHLWVPKKYWVFFPNWNAVGLGFVVPQLQYSIAMAIGSVVAYFWMTRNPKSYDLYGFAVSAGMLAGEGLGGVFQALLSVAGVLSDYGLAVGCPLNSFCG